MYCMFMCLADLVLLRRKASCSIDNILFQCIFILKLSLYQHIITTLIGNLQFKCIKMLL